MEDKLNGLTIEQYHILYMRALSYLEDISNQVEKAMLDLGKIQLSMGDK